jgi:hypothetical protein
MERFPEKIEARRQVHLAIKKGILKRQPCEVCRDPKSEGHHPDHSKPLEVIWLCRQHHREIENQEHSLKEINFKESDSISELKYLQITTLEVIHTKDQSGNQYLMEF